MLTSHNRELFLITKKSGDAKKSTTKPDREMPDPVRHLSLRHGETRHITEIHMGNLGMSHVHPNFMQFVNLETLWLNGNELTEFAGVVPAFTGSYTDSVKGCTRLKCLNLSNNHLNTVVGDLQKLKFIERLVLSNNKLSNMELVASQLSHLRVLKQLDLFGNPLVEEQNYRLFFIYQFPSLTLFDQQTVTDTERKEAAAVIGAKADASAKAAFGSHLPPARPMQPVKELSLSVQHLEQKVRSINHRDKMAKARESQREELEFASLAEKRRVFHTLWGKAAPSEADKHMSSLFLNNPNVDKLVKLVQEREATKVEEEWPFIDAEIAALKAFLVPERATDTFHVPLQKAKQATADEDQWNLEERIIGALLSDNEQDSIRSVFDGGKLSYRDAQGLLEIVAGKKLPAADFVERFQKTHGTEDVDIRAAEVSLGMYLPFVQFRIDQLHKEGQEHLARGNTGASMGCLRRCNVLSDQVVALEAEAINRPNKGQPRRGEWIEARKAHLDKEKALKQKAAAEAKVQRERRRRDEIYAQKPKSSLKKNESTRPLSGSEKIVKTNNM